jgi:hypothetical protein
MLTSGSGAVTRSRMHHLGRLMPRDDLVLDDEDVVTR